jgi:hypothetical protein
MPPHRLRRAALHLLPRRSERGLLYFHHGLLEHFSAIDATGDISKTRRERTKHQAGVAPISNRRSNN